MKTIKTKNDINILVDDQDFGYLSAFNWSINDGYAVRWVGRTCIRMHREILGLSRADADVVDHANGNKLDNRRENLRPCTQVENSRNRRVSKNKFGYKGVVGFSFGKYQAMIWDGKKNINLGRFSVLEDAARAYDAAAVRLFGEYAATNFERG